MFAAPAGMVAVSVAVDCATLNVVGVTNPPTTEAPTGTVPREVVPLKNCAVPDGASPALLVSILRVIVRLVRVPTPPETGTERLELVFPVVTAKFTGAEVLELKLA